MHSRLLTTVDRALQQRARTNALSAVRDGQVHAAQRHEAERAMAARLPAAGRLAR